MFANKIGSTSAIIADYPDSVQGQVQKISEYISEALSFAGHMATDHPNEFVTAMATLVVAIFTAILAIATIRLWNSTAELARFAEQQASDMKASIAAAEAANVLNKQNIVASRRAWVSIDDVKLRYPTKFSEEEIVFGVNVTVKNHGQTPANSVWIEFESHFIEDPSVSFQDAQKQFKAKLRVCPIFFGQLLFPNETFTQGQVWADGPDKIKDTVRGGPTS